MKALDCHPDKHPDDLMAGKLQIKKAKFQLKWLGCRQALIQGEKNVCEVRCGDALSKLF